MSTAPTDGTDGGDTATLRGSTADVSWTDLGQELWSYLTGRGAAISYTFVDMAVEVPRDTGPDAPRATWKLDGTLRITTSDDQLGGADPYRD